MSFIDDILKAIADFFSALTGSAVPSTATTAPGTFDTGEGIINEPIIPDAESQIPTSDLEMLIGPFASYYVTYARKYGVPLEIVLAVSEHESRFDPNARNEEIAADKVYGHDVTSVGLMQILYPDTANSIGSQIGRRFGSLSDLFDPATNIECGTYLLSQLLRRFPELDSDAFPAKAIASYNAGSPKYKTDGSFTNQSYVDSVKENWFVWRTYNG